MNDLIVSQNRELNTYLLDLESKIEMLAAENIRQYAESGNFTGPELYSMKLMEMFDLTGDIDTAQTLLKGKIISEFEQRKLYSEHPERFNSAEEAFKSKFNLSKSEYSNYRDIWTIILPFVTRRLGMSFPEFWRNCQKSNIREMLPALKILATGKPSKRNSVNEGLQRILEEVIDQDGDIVENAARQIIEYAHDTNDSLRNRLRPSRTDPIEAYILRRNGTRYVLAKVNEDQVTMMVNVMGRHMETMAIDMDQEPPGTLLLVKELMDGHRAA